MAKFTYLVTVEVDDGDVEITDWNTSEFYGDGDGMSGETFPADTRAEIVMRERLGCDENYGFEYSVDYEQTS